MDFELWHKLGMISSEGRGTPLIPLVETWRWRSGERGLD
jgi:hypothetical protein